MSFAELLDVQHALRSYGCELRQRAGITVSDSESRSDVCLPRGAQ
jgi:hypothetical protein